MKSKKVSKVLIVVVLAILAVYTLFPLAFLFINSFKTNAEIINTPLALPTSWTFDYITTAAGEIHFFQALLITVVVTAISVGLIVLVSSLAAWVMVRNKNKFSNVLLLLFTAAMLIPFQAIMYPLINVFDAMNLKNLIGLVIMYGGFGLSLSIFLYHGFIKSVPRSIEEAAVIDGASIPQMFFTIVFPLLKTTTVTVVILNAMWIWNDYLLPYLVIGDNSNKTLTLELYFAKMISGAYGNPYQLIFPAVLVSIIPIIIVFLCLQKYFVKGVSDGAVKS